MRYDGWVEGINVLNLPSNQLGVSRCAHPLLPVRNHQQRDPITEAPRYGERTASRVKALLASYDALVEAIRLVFEGEEQDHDTGTSKAVVVQDLQNIVAQQKEETRRAALQEEVRLKKVVEQEEERVKQLLQEEERQEEEARSARECEERELARRAQEVRAARQEAERRALETERMLRQERERADREWMDSIAKGPDGVRTQLQRLREGTANDPVAFQTALHALHKLFFQIVSRPEEANFRRVRRAHPKFHEDIGQHAGGRELLIAAGFRAGLIDDVPCFISTEPDIEKEMDAWAEWFELLKVTLEILEQEMLK